MRNAMRNGLILVLALAFPALLFGCAGNNGNGGVCAAPRQRTTEFHDGLYVRQPDGSFVQVAAKDDEDPDDDEIEPGNLVEGDFHDYVDAATTNMGARVAIQTQDTLLRARQSLRGPEGGASQGPQAGEQPVQMVAVRRTDAQGNVRWVEVPLPTSQQQQGVGSSNGNGAYADIALRQNYSEADGIAMDDLHRGLDVKEHQTNAKWREDARKMRKRRGYINDARTISREIRYWGRCWR